MHKMKTEARTCKNCSYVLMTVHNSGWLAYTIQHRTTAIFVVLILQTITTVQTLRTGRMRQQQTTTEHPVNCSEPWHTSKHTRQQHISQTSAEIWHTWCQSIENDDGDVDGAMTMYIEHSHESHHKHASSDCQELRTNACKQRIQPQTTTLITEQNTSQQQYSCHI